MDLGLKQDEPTMIMDDNQACIAMSNNPIIQKRTKHIDVRYHFVREKVESKEVEDKQSKTLRINQYPINSSVQPPFSLRIYTNDSP